VLSKVHIAAKELFTSSDGFVPFDRTAGGRRYIGMEAFLRPRPKFDTKRKRLARVDEGRKERLIEKVQGGLEAVGGSLGNREFWAFPETENTSSSSA